MKKLSILLSLLLLPSLLWASPPARVFSYSDGDVIQATKNTQNEDAIFNYLSRGVDTLADNSVTSSKILDGTIANADIAGTAAITYPKLSLSGSVTSTDILDGTIAAGDIGTLTTIDINGGTLDGVTIGGATAGAGSFTSVVTGTLTATANLDIGTYNFRANTLESDVATGTAPLTVASTTVVTNLNADQIDGFHSTNIGFKSLYTSSGTFTNPTGITTVYLTMCGGGGGAGGGGGGSNSASGGGGSGACISKRPYTVDAGSYYTVTINTGGNGGTTGTESGSAGGSAAFGLLTISGGNGGGGSVSTAGSGGTTPSMAIAGGAGGYGVGNNGAIGIVSTGGGGGGGSLLGEGGDGTLNDAAGENASGYGAGGGGCARGSGLNCTGGTGSPAIVITEW